MTKLVNKIPTTNIQTAKEYAVFILTYGRPYKVYTYNTLRRQGYTGDIYFICSDDDKTLPEYQELYGDKVLIFSKDKEKKTTQVCDNFGKEKDGVVVYARNKNFQFARELGYKYFIQLDDDYTEFQFKIPRGEKLDAQVIRNLDLIFKSFLDYLKNTPQINALAFAQGGDFIGGVNNGIETAVLRRRKLMNAYFFRSDDDVYFLGRLNEDVNMYTYLGSKGCLFLTIPYISVVQLVTQTNSGGLTESYKDNGTYVKSFYSVIIQPSSVKVKQINGNSFKRIHHGISWKHTVPHIIREQSKKIKK